MHIDQLPEREAYHQPIRWYSWAVPLMILLVVLGLAAAGGWWYVAHFGILGSKSADGPVELRPVTARGDLMPFEQSIIDIHKKSAPSVVHITSLTVRRDASRNVYQVPEGTGSGIVWDKKGHIVTNYHVIRGANAAKVTLADGSEWSANLVDIAPEKDIAVLSIDAGKDKLTPIDIGSSNNLQVGQIVFAIGNPFGLDHTLTMGIISALHREIESQAREEIKDVIQTDAAINPGNSGGPLIDSAGRLIGINTAIYSPSGASAGIGFAIPVDEVNQTVTKLINSAGKKSLR
jgi:S1-C subfamily serine protease